MSGSEFVRYSGAWPHWDKVREPVSDLEWLCGQVVALCEETEERYAAIAEHDHEGKQGAFARGRILEAKSIRNTICEVVRERKRAARAPKPKDPAQ